MNTSRVSTSLQWITTGVFFVFYFLYFIVLNRYLLSYQEQIQFFRFDRNYFEGFLSRPGGLMEYSGAFLTQFYLFPFAGASIVTMAGIATYLITMYIFRKHRIIGVVQALVPVLFLGALHTYYLYSLAYTIGLIVTLGYFAVYISIHNYKLRYLIVFSGWPVLYFLTGGYALVTMLLCILHELFFSCNHSRFIVTPVFLMLALLVPYLASHLIFFIKAGMAWTFFLPLFIESPGKYVLILLLVYHPIVLIVSKVWMAYSKKVVISAGWNWKTIIAGTLVIVCLAGCIIKYVYNRKSEIILGLDYCVQRSDWDGALKLSSSYTGTNRLVMYFTNLALYKSGHMGDQLFHFPQAGISGLYLDWKRDGESPFFGGEIYYQLGYTSEAYRWAFEAMVAKGPNPRSLKRLIVTSLINGEIVLAEKYLSVLDQTLFYRKWAKRYQSYIDDQELLNDDMEISEKRYFEIHSDFIRSDNFGAGLQQLLENHSDNRIAFEYFMASLLLEKNLRGFADNIYRLKELGYKSIPEYYEEALLAYMSFTKKNIVPEGYAISMATSNLLSEFANTIYSFGNNTNMAATSMYSKFGKTYWYYLKFINSKP